VGIDVSEPMLAPGRLRTEREQVQNVSWRHADAQTDDVGGPYDGVYSRFGTMFFADPVGAFANIRGACRPGARMAFVCWAPPEENPWVARPIEVLLPFVPEPPEPLPPDAPGPFALADPQRVASILDGAGWRDVSQVEHRIGLLFGSGDGVEGALRMILRSPAGRLLDTIVDPEAREQALDALRAELTRHASRDGVQLLSVGRVVTALA
jgi:SAM-dependent methyltransferase